MGFLARYPVYAMLPSGKNGVVDDVRFIYDTKSGIKSRVEASVSGKTGGKGVDTNLPIDRSRFVYIKVYSTEKGFDFEDIYVRLMFSQTTHCLLAPHTRGDFAQRDQPPMMVSINDPIFDEARSKLEPLVAQAIGLWRSMVIITRHHGKNISFVGEENGSISVLGPAREQWRKCEQVGLSEEVLSMLGGAARMSFLR
jgi:hypothetical protein